MDDQIDKVIQGFTQLKQQVQLFYESIAIHNHKGADKSIQR